MNPVRSSTIWVRALLNTLQSRFPRWKCRHGSCLRTSFRFELESLPSYYLGLLSALVASAAAAILIVPSVFAALLGVREGMRLPLAWGFGIAMSFLGMTLSYFLDFPTGASVVVVFALGLFPVLLLKKR